jgi:acetyl-CoA carboxylase biotin carboxyl carrier protein
MTEPAVKRPVNQGAAMSRQKSAIDAELIRELARVLNETDLTEIEVQQADLRIRVARQVTVQATVPVAAAPVVHAAPVAAAGPAPVVGAVSSVPHGHDSA